MGANCGITGQTSFEALWRTFIGNYVPIVDSPQHSSPVLFLHFVHSIYIKTLYSSHGGLDLEDTYKSQRSYHSLLEKSGMDFLPELKRFEEAKVQYFDIYHDDNLSSTDRREFFKQKLKELIRPPATWFDTSFRSVSHGRRLMLTEKNILGLAPSKAEVGDKIYFIQGAQVPYVLRKYAASGKLQLVGDVYLHGLMQGELEKFEPLERVNGFLD